MPVCAVLRVDVCCSYWLSVDVRSELSAAHAGHE